MALGALMYFIDMALCKEYCLVFNIELCKGNICRYKLRCNFSVRYFMKNNGIVDLS